MCTRLCLCNSCYKKKTCTDCQYIGEHIEVDCNDGGIDECKHYNKRLSIAEDFMRKNKNALHSYFVCYQALSLGNLKTANIQVDLEKPIRSFKDIECIVQLLLKENPDAQVTILNYQKFESEPR